MARTPISDDGTKMALGLAAVLGAAELYGKFRRAGSRATSLPIGYGAYNVLQRYWWGQSDPLYAVLSRRGPSVDRVTVQPSPGEMDRLREAAEEAGNDQENTEGERRSARLFLAEMEALVG